MPTLAMAAAKPPQVIPTMNGSPSFAVTIAEVYAPIAMNPACPNENIPVNPVSMHSPNTAMTFIPHSIIIPLIYSIQSPKKYLSRSRRRN